MTFTVAFGWTIVLISIAGAAAQDGQEYVSKRVDAIQATLPPNIEPNSTAARTYLYWLKAADEVNICTDVERLIRDRGRLRHSFGIGDPVKQALRRLQPLVLIRRPLRALRPYQRASTMSTPA